MAIPYPLTNGVYPDFASITMLVAGERIPIGLTEINYEDNLEPGEVRGNSAQLIGRTLGQYSATADFTCFKPQMAEVLSVLQRRGGIYQVSFNLVVSYERAATLHTDEVLGCRIQTLSDGHSEGTDGLTQQATLHTMGIVRDGRLPYAGFRKP
ncbi:hypothetical protein [Myxococcus phage Mx4 ts27htf-1hrm-1]|nr:hypothetical protein Mx4_p56 [Myxococcus phage Mx4]WNM70395.1 hypothetical protein [Myxococcus phage Mx4 ts27htf-1hrm-1]